MADSIHFPSGLRPHRGNSEYPAFLLTDVICGGSLPTQGIPLYTTPYNLHSISRSGQSWLQYQALGRTGKEQTFSLIYKQSPKGEATFRCYLNDWGRGSRGRSEGLWVTPPSHTSNTCCRLELPSESERQL